MSFDLLPLPAVGWASSQMPPPGDPEHAPPGPARPGDPIHPEPLGPTPPNLPPLDPSPDPGPSLPRALGFRRDRAYRDSARHDHAYRKRAWLYR